jgi:hypothetical protein
MHSNALDLLGEATRRGDLKECEAALSLNHAWIGGATHEIITMMKVFLYFQRFCSLLSR